MIHATMLEALSSFYYAEGHFSIIDIEKFIHAVSTSTIYVFLP